MAYEPQAVPLFPRWATTVFRLSLVLLIGVIVALPLSLLAWERTPYVTGADDPQMQPVKFDHRHHVRDAAIPCSYCHADTQRSPNAGLPAVALCMGCHAQIWRESPELAPVRAAYFLDTTLKWQRVTRLPDFVFFDHSAHVRQGVGCVTCHGRVDDMGQVFAVRTFNMKFCLDCHRDPARFQLNPAVANTPAEPDPLFRGQTRAPWQVSPSTDCSACHR